MGRLTWGCVCAYSILGERRQAVPSKSQRAASRQARVRNRRKKGRPAPQTFQAAPAQRRQEDEEAAAMAAKPVATAAAPSMATATAARPARRARRAPEAATAEYPYMKPELIRIGAMSSVVLVIIAGLTFVLG